MNKRRYEKYKKEESDRLYNFLVENISGSFSQFPQTESAAFDKKVFGTNDRRHKKCIKGVKKKGKKTFK